MWQSDISILKNRYGLVKKCEWLKNKIRFFYLCILNWSSDKSSTLNPETSTRNISQYISLTNQLIYEITLNKNNNFSFLTEIIKFLQDRVVGVWWGNTMEKCDWLKNSNTVEPSRPLFFSQKKKKKKHAPLPTWAGPTEMCLSLRVLSYRCWRGMHFTGAEGGTALSAGPF